jgi:hypothetical protein
VRWFLHSRRAPSSAHAAACEVLRAAMFVMCIAVVPAQATAAGTLRQARIHVAITTPYTCEVTAEYTVESAGPADIEHRIQLFEGAGVELLEVTGGGRQLDSPKVVGRTQSLTVRVGQAGPVTYTLRYRVRQPDDWVYRCPTWIPTVPADGTSRAVVIDVELPSGAQASGGGVPAFQWSGGRGTATLAHVPAFVGAPYTTTDGPAAPRSWDIARLMDLLAVGVLVSASVLWAWTRKKG